MGDGHEANEPNGQRFCEVIRIGIEDNTAEVIIFYTPERGQFVSAMNFSSLFLSKQTISDN